MITIQQILVFLLLYICVYALIDRICKCIEHCSIARAYSKFKENGAQVKLDTIRQQIEEFRKAGKHGESGTTQDGASTQN